MRSAQELQEIKKYNIGLNYIRKYNYLYLFFQKSTFMFYAVNCFTEIKVYVPRALRVRPIAWLLRSSTLKTSRREVRVRTLVTLVSISHGFL